MTFNNKLMTVPPEFFEALQISIEISDKNNTTKSIIEKSFLIQLNEIFSSIIGSKYSLKSTKYLCQKLLSTFYDRTVNHIQVIFPLTILVLKAICLKGNTVDYSIMWFCNIFNCILQEIFLNTQNYHMKILHIYALRYIVTNCTNSDQYKMCMIVLKYFLCRNGLVYLHNIHKQSLMDKDNFGIIHTKYLFGEILAMIEIFNTSNDVSYERFFSTRSRQLNWRSLRKKYVAMAFQLPWEDLDLKICYIPENINCKTITLDYWEMIILVLYAIFKYAKFGSSILIFGNINSFIQIAIVKEFNISNVYMKCLLEMYAVSIRSRESDP